ncbi:hypothetical protein GGI42DRAFT_347995 [Trichoderma sp. SZMC 28013]
MAMFKTLSKIGHVNCVYFSPDHEFLENFISSKKNVKGKVSMMAYKGHVYCL